MVISKEGVEMRAFKCVQCRRFAAVSVVLMVLLVGTTGCTNMKDYYVIQETPALSYGEISKDDDKQSLDVTFEFQTNGQMNPGVTNRYRAQVIGALNQTGCFSEVHAGVGRSSRSLHLVVNNVVDSLGGAVMQGFFSGLTFGLIGTKVTDNYAIEAVYSGGSGDSTNSNYGWSLTTTSGLIHAGVSNGTKHGTLDSAFDRLLEQVVLRVISDLQAKNKL